MSALETGSEQSFDSELKWRILCVDDEPDILTVLKAALSTKHEVVTALSGVEALKIIGACEPDFIICDIRMPKMDGYQTVEAIRKQPAYSDIPVFFLTAERGKDAARKGFAAGCNLFLTKPFDPIRLLENIEYFTRESGHVVRPKGYSLDQLERMIEAVRRAPDTAQALPPPPAPAAAPRRLSPQATAEPPASIPKLASELFAEYTNQRLKAEHSALEADRKAREQEYWRKKYAQIQTFIDRHMRD